MIPVDQRTDSDCLRACIASLLTVPYYDIPDFDILPGQWLRFDRFMERDSLRPVGIPPDKFCVPYNAYYLVQGKSPRGLDHSVIGLNGEIVHDPHPSRAGLETIDRYVIFVAFLHAVGMHDDR
jgi:hypothetical protein